MAKSNNNKINVTKVETNNEIINKKNYKIIVIGIVIISIGYIFMLGGKSNNPSVFDEKIIYSFQRLTLSPILIVIGFAVVFYGIFKENK